MNNIILKTIGICIIIGLLIPVTVGSECDSDDTDISTDSVIASIIDKIDDDGHLIFNVSNYAIKDLNNVTMHIHFYGSGPFTALNKVDVNTEIFIQNLPIGESELFKTKDQVFKVRLLFRRPLVPFFSGEMNLVFNGYSRISPITKMLAFIHMDLIIIPYP